MGIARVVGIVVLSVVKVDAEEAPGGAARGHMEEAVVGVKKVVAVTICLARIAFLAPVAVVSRP